MSKWSETIDRYLREGRTVSGGTHGKEKSMAEARQKESDARSQKAFDTQMSTLKDLKSGLSKYISGNQGFDPEQLALMKSDFLSGEGQGFNNARSNVMSALRARGSAGGAGPVGGDFARPLSGLYGAQASDTASGLRGINLSNLQQALQNKFGAAQILSGNANTLNSPISAFTNSADNALNERIRVGLTPGIGGQFLASFGQGLGAGLTGGVGSLAAKGLGGLLNKTPSSGGGMTGSGPGGIS